ncbi:hypothetical protein HB820_08895 [Listeria booriae]|uniref:hypothetical protein n=1 Tax=Listeria booriae TaxID=1552123 RepID=UPI001626A47D|nr:hypothetical protein [Listeria booriae]MBC1335419.1 hypothetical protein [Listeria booriae]
MKLNTTSFMLIIISVLLTSFAAASLILLMVNKGIIIDEKTVDLLDMYVKAAFVFLGSFLSGLTAFTIFSLQEHSKKRALLEAENKYYNKLSEEFERNKSTLSKLYAVINKASTEEQFVADLKKDDASELLKIIIIEMDFSFFDVYSKEISDLRNKEFLAELFLVKQLYKYIVALSEDITIDENKLILLKLIKRDLSTMRAPKM